MRGGISFSIAVLAISFFGASCSRAQTGDALQGVGRSFLLDRIEKARRDGGEEEVWQMLSDEFRYGLFWEEWCRTVLEYVKEKGTTDMIPAIDSLLRPPKGSLSRRLRGWPSATVRTLGSEAWCSIEERECVTKAEKLQFLAALLDTITTEPPLTPSREFCQGFMKSLLPESRAIVYDVLKDPARSYGYEQTPEPRVFLEAALSLTEFSPTDEEKHAILSRAGTLGKVLLLRRMGATPEAKACWQMLRMDSHSRVRNMAYQYLVLFGLTRLNRTSMGACEALDDYLAYLRKLQAVTPLNEELKYEGLSLLACLARRHEIPGIREYAAALLAEQPELRLKDLANRWDSRIDKIDQFAKNVRTVAGYRKKARETAQSILDKWDKWREERSDPRMEGEPRIRWFLDGKELPGNEEGPGGGDL